MRLRTYELWGLGIIGFLFILTVISLQMSTNISNLAGLGGGQAAGVITSEDGTITVDGDEQIRDLIINEIDRGSGRVVTAGDRVTVHYVGTLSDGQQFDSSKDRGQPFTFIVGAGRVIQGWEEGILGMREGGSRILVVPPHLGYGERAVGNIPAHSTLIFTVELLEIE